MAKTKADADGAGDKKGKGKRKLFMIIGVVVVLAAGAFVGLQFFGSSDAEAEEVPSEAPSEGEVVDVATITTMAGGNTLARIGLAVVLSEGTTADMATAKFPLLKDAAVSELASTYGEDLRNAEEADALRKRLTKRAKEIYPDGEVLRVLITELVIQ